MECKKKAAFRKSTDLGFGLFCGDQPWDSGFYPLKKVPLSTRKFLLGVQYLTKNYLSLIVKSTARSP